MSEPEAGTPRVASETTELLRAWTQGDEAARDQLIERVYPQLRRLASARWRSGAAGEVTLAPTEIVHEAYMRLVDQRQVDWRSRAQFFALAARLIRRIILNHVRDRSRLKRGGEAVWLSLDAVDAHLKQAGVDLGAVDEALRELAEIDPEGARVVELRYFGGLTTREIALLLDTSERTVERRWNASRLWLRAQLGPSA